MKAVTPQVTKAKHVTIKTHNRNTSVSSSWSLAPSPTQKKKNVIIQYITPLNAIVLHQKSASIPFCKKWGSGDFIVSKEI